MQHFSYAWASSAAERNPEPHAAQTTPPTRMCTHAHPHPCVHAPTRAHALACAHAPMPTHAHAHMHPHARAQEEFIKLSEIAEMGGYSTNDAVAMTNML